jgi:hypothetical protein
MAKKTPSSSTTGKKRFAKAHGRRKTAATKPVRKTVKKAKKTTFAGSKKASKAKAGRKQAKAPARAGSKAAPKRGKKTPGRKASGARKKAGSESGDFIFLDHTTEDLFASQLLEEIEFRHGVDVATIDVRIRDGIAVARGTVSDLEELEAVRETMQDAGGITDLTFVVQVAPDRREADRDRARQIQEILDSDSDLASDNVLVACVGRKVIVRGSVATRLRKVKAGLMALRLGDSTRVANRLVVLSD